MTTAAVASGLSVLFGVGTYVWLAPRNPRVCADCTGPNYFIGALVVGAIVYTCAAFAVAGIFAVGAAALCPHWTIKGITRWSIAVGAVVPPLLAWLLW